MIETPRPAAAPFLLKLVPSLIGAATMIAVACISLLSGAARAEPAIWVVKGPHATVYLFGTIHMLKSDAQWMTPKIKTAFEASDKLTLEIADPDNAAALQPLVQKLGFDADHPLSSVLTPADETKLNTAEAALGLPPTAIEPMRPWLAALTLTVVPIVKQGYDPAEGADRQLKAAADSRKEPVDGFETGEQQLRFFADMSTPEQVAFLREALDEYPEVVGRVRQLETAWQAGDVAKISALVNEDMKKQYPALYALLLVHRNEAFAAVIAERLKGTGVSFVAVGAGHLAGPDSVQAQLAKRGLVAQRF